MRTSIKSLMTGVLMLAGLVHAGNAMAADGSFEVINSNNNVSIQAVWVAGAGLPNDPWSSITLSSPVGPDGIRDFTTQGYGCSVDVKVQYSDGVIQTFDNVNACRNDKVLGT